MLRTVLLFSTFVHQLSCDLCSKEEECTFFSVLKMKCVNMSIDYNNLFLFHARFKNTRIQRIQEYKEYKIN